MTRYLVFMFWLTIPDKKRNSRVMNSEKNLFCHYAGLWSWVSCLLLTLVASSQQQQPCAPSSCGKIRSIGHPFRLRADPEHCGDRSYELACENNVTILHLYSGKYHVQAINYNNFTIRVVDPGIEEENCSSIPRYFLYRSNFTKDVQGSYRATAEQGFSFERPIFQHVVYLNCSNPVKDDPEYVDTTSCVNWNSESDGHIYAIAGDLEAGRFRDDCHVKLVVAIAMNWDREMDLRAYNRSFSYAVIHRVLAHGFELSWLHRACQDHCESMGTGCYLDDSSEQLQCLLRHCYIFGMPIFTCGLWSQLKELAQDYKDGFIEGLNGILSPHRMSTYHTITEDFRIGGIFTGRFILPYMALRFLLGASFLSLILIHKWRRRHFSIYQNIEMFLQGYNLMPIRYSYREIKSMTRGFKDKLGQGGFGSVYKGKLRSGPFVAIKMLGKSKGNGQDFISEVETIGRIHHQNVVKLIGFCVEGSKRALVYEFMSNGSLDNYIFSKGGNIPLSYDKIYDISLGVARAIAYLHKGCEMQILHFDIKPHNILLDESFIAKVSDFGLAKSYPVNNSIVTLTMARGTIGYMAPELFYKNIGGVSYKADVYSFGMLLMEMANKRKNLNPHAEHSSQLYFPLWIYDQFNEKKEIRFESVTEEEKKIVKKMIIVALWCIQLKPHDRPSMSKVVEMLEGEVEVLEMPPKPSLYPQETFTEDDGINSNQTVSSDFSSSTGNLDGEIGIDPLVENVA